MDMAMAKEIKEEYAKRSKGSQTLQRVFEELDNFRDTQAKAK